MGEKSVEKKKLIIEKSRSVFAAKGFKAVSMKDLVDACGISRGGLYLYFSSTEEVFLEVLKADNESDDDEAIEAALKNDATASDMLILFVKEQKKQILKKDNLNLASYEFFAGHELDPRENPLKKQFDTAVRIVTRLIENGISAGEFSCSDPMGTARNLMFVVEGLKISECTMGVSEKMVDRELGFILRSLVPEE